MPEGDTLHKVAAALRPHLLGRCLERVILAGRPYPDLCGCPVEAVEAVGKHLLIAFAGGTTLRTHLGLYGSWHRYPRGEPWRKPTWRASAALWTAEQVLVCFNAREVECLATEGLARHPQLGRLGPDLLAPEVALGEVVARARRLGDPLAPVAEALLDQRIAAGIGNVYKSEVLFLSRVHPATPLAGLGDAAVTALYATARRLLAANLGGWTRTTTVDRRQRPDPRVRLWVYGRRGQPCLRCGCPIRHRRLGRGLRSTYWCPGCQAKGGPSSGRP